jgi:hypothetical protein
MRVPLAAVYVAKENSVLLRIMKKNREKMLLIEPVRV